ncbi:hypothetical protein [Leeuwenhoekiella sp. H156]|uniref:hypothetical protein n=1 Tax=Leeuwenhoekiella sp. H156 TaxID=3450128 RepID=UPI003FA46FF4
MMNFEDFLKDDNSNNLEKINQHIFDGYLNEDYKSRFEEVLPMALPDNKREVLNNMADLLDDNPLLLDKLNDVRNRKILFVGSENIGLSDIKVHEEILDLKNITKGKDVKFESVFPNMSNILNKWRNYQADIVIFSCHGLDNALLLKDDYGVDAPIDAIDLKLFFEKRSNHTECVVLSACESLKIAEVIVKSCNNVLAINKKVNIKTARRFTAEFISYICDNPHEKNKVYEEAFGHCRELVTLNGFKDAFAFEFLKSGKL